MKKRVQVIQLKDNTQLGSIKLQLKMIRFLAIVEQLQQINTLDLIKY